MTKTGFARYGWFVLCLLSCLAFLTLLGRVAYIQSVKEIDKQNLNTLGKNIWTKEESLKAERGRILDRNGVEIARDTTSYTLYAVLDKSYPDHIKNPADAAKKLAPLLGMSEKEIVKVLSKEGYFQVEFGAKGKNLKPSLKSDIEALALEGIKFRSETTRFYPNGIFASHAIGYSQYSEELGREEGRMGIEQTYDAQLTGKNGSISYQTDTKGYKLPDPKEQISLPENGDDVYLTIDQKIQTFLDEAVSYVYGEYEPERITAIVADPKTGEILAMANAPGFDPNTREITNYQNDAIKYAFEPGSTMKIFTLAATINEGLWNPNATFQSGTYKLSASSKAIRDHNWGKGWGVISYLEGFQRSSNVLMSKIANEQLGTEKLREYLSAFELDKKTDIDLPGESVGTILYQWPIEKITTAFGQGSTITPIQQVKAVTAITNEGMMMKPYIVKKVVDSETGEVVQENKPSVVGMPIKPETAKEVLNVLETVVHGEDGTGKSYAIDGYKVAGKTGTSQIPNPEGGGYLSGHGNNIFSFMGVVPKENPEFIMYVSVQQPKLELKERGWEQGSHPVSYIFTKVMANSLFYRKVEQTEVETAESSYQLGNLVGHSVTEAKAAVGADAYVVGNGGAIIAQYPEPGMVNRGRKVILVTDGELTMPNLTGWALRDVMRLASMVNMEVSFFGNGYVTKQSITEGEKFSQGGTLVLDLSLTKLQEPQAFEDVEEALGVHGP